MHNGIVGVRGSNPLGSTILRSEPAQGLERRMVSSVAAARRRTLIQIRVQSYGWQANYFPCFQEFLGALKSDSALLACQSRLVPMKLASYSNDKMFHYRCGRVYRQQPGGEASRLRGFRRGMGQFFHRAEAFCSGMPQA